MLNPHGRSCSFIKHHFFQWLRSPARTLSAVEIQEFPGLQVRSLRPWPSGCPAVQKGLPTRKKSCCRESNLSGKDGKGWERVCEIMTGLGNCSKSEASSFLSFLHMVLCDLWDSNFAAELMFTIQPGGAWSPLQGWITRSEFFWQTCRSAAGTIYIWAVLGSQDLIHGIFTLPKNSFDIPRIPRTSGNEDQSAQWHDFSCRYGGCFHLL